MPCVEHPLFIQPSNLELSVWTYMSFTKFLSMISQSSLYFSRIDKLSFSDSYEGSFTRMNDLLLEMNWFKAPSDFWLKLGSKNEEQFMLSMRVQRESRFLQSIQKEFIFVNCWHIGEEESDAMWKIYVGNQDGVCVQTTLASLRASFSDSSESIFLGKVNYNDYKKDFIVEMDTFSPFITKRRCFKHEQELRALIWRHEDIDHRFLTADGSPGTKDNFATAVPVNKDPDRIGINVKVNVKDLVHAIYISSISGNWFVDLVESILAKLGYAFRIHHSELTERPSL